ncbi:Ring zinc finger family protein [Thalictrum thalictroides]|uniref:Ring zinc finger family protein n=1 Tax=Thalictrum thalictroides TaxID=46969 RepID=A0A7J6V2S3_THATH|nr:Ring zinc finger family protein [Thalictrum thalictroides]
MEQKQQEKEDEESMVCSLSNELNPCPICLGPVKQEAYLDRCFHKFCYNCIARWAKYVAGSHSQAQFTLKCPYCKSDNISIVYECEDDNFQRHYINKDPVERTFFSKAHKFRLRCYYCEPGAIYDKFNVQRFWKLHRYLQPNKWLQVWLQREIQALTQEEDVNVVVYHILGSIESFTRQKEREPSKRTIEENREDFRALISDAAKPFLIGRTKRFVNEIELFLVSGLNIEAYDEVYWQCVEMVTSGAVHEDDEERLQEVNKQPPYLHFFDEDSDKE